MIGKVEARCRGTRVRYWADPQIFIKGSHFALDELNRRARQTAFLVPGLQISVTDHRPEALPGSAGHEHATSTTAGSASSSSTSPRTSGSPMSSACREPVRYTETMPGARQERSHGLDGRGPYLRGRHRPALGVRLRLDDAILREHRRDPQGRDSRHRFRAGPGQDLAQAGREPGAPSEVQRQEREDREGRHAGGSDRRGERAHRRTAVRRPDQGDPRDPGDPCDRREDRRAAI